MSEPSKWAVEAAKDCLLGHPIRSRFAPIIQQAIDAATAEKDHEIRRLKESMLIVKGFCDERDQRIAKMAALLGHLRHEWVSAERDGNGLICAIKCATDCPACAWEKMQSTLDGASENFPAKDKKQDE